MNVYKLILFGCILLGLFSIQLMRHEIDPRGPLSITAAPCQAWPMFPPSNKSDSKCTLNPGARQTPEITQQRLDLSARAIDLSSSPHSERRFFLSVQCSPKAKYLINLLTTCSKLSIYTTQTTTSNDSTGALFGFKLAMGNQK